MSAQDYIAKHAPIWAPAGWPEWAGITEQPTPEQARALQRLLVIADDGYPGPATIAACAEEDWRRQRLDLKEGEGLIIIGPRALRIDAPTHTYLDDFDLTTTPHSRRQRAPHQAIIHYDVTYSAASTHKVLKRRELSTHFCIDGDDHGTIWQYHCPALTYTWHGGRTDAGHRVNPGSIGVDLNNPADVRYARRDEQRRGRARPIITERIHGHTVERLDYFPEQITSLKVLMELFEDVFGIPPATPTARGVIAQAHKFRGWLGHYHLTRRKTDPSPLCWENL
jgi:N-acetyl-anhydromuramyl-L-alanine amidase AmpD